MTKLEELHIKANKLREESAETLRKSLYEGLENKIIKELTENPDKEWLFVYALQPYIDYCQDHGLTYDFYKPAGVEITKNMLIQYNGMFDMHLRIYLKTENGDGK